MPRKHERLLALAPFPQGFGYLAIEGEACLLDWGISYVTPRRPAASLPVLLRDYTPNRLLVPESAPSQTRRERLAHLAALAREEGFTISRVGPRALATVFSGKLSKYERAARLADHFPALRPRLPHRRMSWMSEDDRMALFEAAAVLAAHLGLHIG